MQRLRAVHLYLGCVFAPMLLFFAVSGIWQSFKLHYAADRAPVLARLSTIHTDRPLKAVEEPSTLSTPVLRAYVIAMAAGVIVTTILGIIMAMRFGNSRRAAYYCLAFGCLFPLILILIRAFA